DSQDCRKVLVAAGDAEDALAHQFLLRGGGGASGRAGLGSRRRTCASARTAGRGVPSTCERSGLALSKGHGRKLLVLRVQSHLDEIEEAASVVVIEPVSPGGLELIPSHLGRSIRSSRPDPEFG